MTNFEKIKNMTVNELTEYLEENYLDLIEIILSEKEEIQEWLLGECEQ